MCTTAPRAHSSITFGTAPPTPTLRCATQSSCTDKQKGAFHDYGAQVRQGKHFRIGGVPPFNERHGKNARAWALSRQVKAYAASDLGQLAGRDGSCRHDWWFPTCGQSTDCQVFARLQKAKQCYGRWTVPNFTHTRITARIASSGPNLALQPKP